MSFGKIKSKKFKAEKARVGGGGFATGVLKATVTSNKLINADSGAIGLNVEIKDQTGYTHRLTEYFVSGKSKGNKTYYTDQSGNSKPLIGFTMINNLCIVTTGKGILENEKQFKKKVGKVWNKKKQKEVTGKITTLPKMTGKKIHIAVQTVVVDIPKKKNGRMVFNKQGRAKPSGEFRTTSKIVDFLDSKQRSAFEIENKFKKPDFAPKFHKKWSKQKDPIDLTEGKAYTAKSKKSKKGKKGKKGKNSKF